MNKSYSKLIVLFIVDILIYSISFLVIFYIRKGSLNYFAENTGIFTLYLLAVIFSSLLTRKFKIKDYKSYSEVARSYLIAFAVTLGFIAFFVNIFDLQQFSRKILISSLATAVIIELIWIRVRLRKTLTESRPVSIILSSNSFFIEIIILASIIVYLGYLSYGKFQNSPDWKYHLVELIICWFVSISLTYHFGPSEFKKSFWVSVWGHIKSYIILLSLVGFLIFSIKLEDFDKLIFISGSILYSSLSFIIFAFVYIQHRPNDTDEIKFKIIKATTFNEVEAIGVGDSSSYQYRIPESRTYPYYFSEKIEKVYLKKSPEVFKFITKRVDLSSVDFITAVVIRSSDPYNIETMPDEFLSFFFNLHPMNDIRRLNHYFIEVNNKLIMNGIFAGMFETTKNRFERFTRDYPFYLGRIFYFFDFIWRRVFPKLPFFQKIYFTLTRGNNRAISLAEGLGRLYFCGFEVIDLKEIDSHVYFIVKKVKEPSKDKNPSYGLFFKMARIGKDGKRIFVYKMRTMHPYSEYLQRFVFEKFSLKEGGKFQNDFRISSWGRVMRKLWIDELPMIINFLEGDLKLIGVRPLSFHYLSLYSEELRKKRQRVKPGLIPPFYYDLPKTLEEIMDSEERYLDQYFKSPILTDVKYFFKCGYNIFIKRARSA